MAQLVKLKRTSVEGRKPTTSNLSLGELAINTYDGKIYFEKDNGTPSIKEIATEDSHHFYTTSFDSRYVNLTGNETIAGNKTFSNNITIVGNLSVEGTTTTIDSTTVNIGDNTLELNYGGSQTTGGILVKDATGSSTVSGSLLWDSTNDYWKSGKLGSEEEILLRNTHGVISGSIQIDHDSTTNFVANEHIDHSSITIGSGKGLTGGGTITTNRSLSLDTGSNHFVNGVKTKLDADSVISGSNLDGMTVSGSFSGSFQGDGSGLVNVTTEITEVSTVSDTFTNATSKVVTHNFGTKNVIVTVYGNDDSYFIPNSIVTTDTNTVTVTFASTESGRVVVAKGGHIVQGVAADDSTLLDGENAAYYLNYNNHTNTPTTISSGQASKIEANHLKVGYTDALVKTKLDADALISGSSQITDLTTHKETVSGASSYAIDHNLNEQYPIVQCWNTSTSQQEHAQSVTTNSENRVTVVFSTTFAGKIIVKK
jgi:hypothetical protein